MSVRIEIAKKQSKISTNEIEELLISLINEKKLEENAIIRIPSKIFPQLDKFSTEIHSITTNKLKHIDNRNDLQIFYYEFNGQDPESESIASHDSEVTASIHWMLPNEKEFFGLWESLVYEENLKENLLDFAETMLLFSQKKVDQNIVSCNRLILLHGLPGTGKTSLAKALAQKLSIQMNDIYQFTHLFEINSHSLFSKWFSESGKLVMKMFQQIEEVAEMESNLVCVLIDEVESIAFARGNISSNEPSDSVRVVNAVLTQLDKIKKYSNVLIITTSNLTSSIDLAYLDRADIVLYIDKPSVDAIYKIYRTAIVELLDKGIIMNDKIDTEFDVECVRACDKLEDFKKFETKSNLSTNFYLFHQICQDSVSFSGRTLRKMPFLAHALFVKKCPTDYQTFLTAMSSAVKQQKESKSKIGQFNQPQQDQITF